MNKLFATGLVLFLASKTFAGSEGEVSAAQLLALTNSGTLIRET